MDVARSRDRNFPLINWCQAPLGFRGRQCTHWDLAWWHCEGCDQRFPPESAEVFIDGVLCVRCPECDQDPVLADKGGRS